MTPAPMSWLKRLWEDGGILFYQEIDAEGWPIRQVELVGPEREPQAAAEWGEFVTAMRSPDMETRLAFRRRFGGVADQRVDLEGGRYHGDVISREEFEREWVRARTILENKELPDQPAS